MTHVQNLLDGMDLKSNKKRADVVKWMLSEDERFPPFFYKECEDGQPRSVSFHYHDISPLISMI